MLSINGKKFMTLPEAVQWLLDNNALPFQCKANYVADTVIAKSDIINPSPAEIKVGSLVLFADSKVGTVSGLTDSGFMVGQDYTDIGSQLNQIISIDQDASQHLIFTLSNGDTIDAGLVKGLSGFSINASQHLIANYNDGSTQDLGAIFQGNVNIAGNFTADSIIENMSGYSATVDSNLDDWTKEVVYVGAVKTGNKITLAVCMKLTKLPGSTAHPAVIDFVIPADIGAKLFPAGAGGGAYLDQKVIPFFSGGATYVLSPARVNKVNNALLQVIIRSDNLVENTEYIFRYEVTFLLSDSLV